MDAQQVVQHDPQAIEHIEAIRVMLKRKRYELALTAIKVAQDYVDAKYDQYSEIAQDHTMYMEDQYDDIMAAVHPHGYEDGDE